MVTEVRRNSVMLTAATHEKLMNIAKTHHVKGEDVIEVMLENVDHQALQQQLKERRDAVLENRRREKLARQAIKDLTPEQIEAILAMKKEKA